MSVLDGGQLAIFTPYLRVQRYDRDGGHKNPRYRIEFDFDVFIKVLGPGNIGAPGRILMPCVACGSPIHPFRQRRVAKTPSRRASGLGRWYYAATCPLDVNKACCRGDKAKEEYKRVVDYVLRRKAVFEINKIFGKMHPSTSCGKFAESPKQGDLFSANASKLTFPKLSEILERSLSNEIDVIKTRLSFLYMARRGMLFMKDIDSEIYTTWCACCGERGAREAFRFCEVCENGMSGK